MSNTSNYLNIINLSFSDYINIIKKKGLINFLIFFKENIFFDIINGTKTNFKFNHTIKNNDIIHYQPSFFKSVKGSIEYLKKEKKIDFSNFNFVDLGCGAGKSLIIASKYNFKDLLGIEIEKNLSKIATNNLDGYKNVTIKNMDILNYNLYKNNTIFYLYNPFSELFLKKFLKKINNLNNIYIIYNNYEFGYDLFKYFQIIFNKKVGKHKFENENILILKKITS